MKEIYGMIHMPISIKCESLDDAELLVNDYNFIDELVVNGQKLKIHDVDIQWEIEFDDEE